MISLPKEHSRALSHWNAQIWIESGHYSDRGAELRISFAEPIPTGYDDFWIPFSGPKGDALGWIKFSYIATVHQESIFAASQWHSANDSAPPEQACLPLPLGPLLAGFLPER